MSRVGKIPIPVPSGVTVTTDGTTVTAKGPKGELVRKLSGGVTAKLESGSLKIERSGNEAQDKALHGMYRSILKGMVDGVAKGYEKRLEVVGVSYQAAVESGKLKLNVGFSHPVLLPIPKNIQVVCPSVTQILVSGTDKQAVGEFAARVRRTRKPEPYKGKGVRYSGEQIVQKAGKSFVSGGEK